MTSKEEADSDFEVIRESAEFVADNAFRLLRLDLILIGIYLTVGGYLSSLNTTLQQAIGTSWYLVASVVLLLMSIVAGYLTYESAGRIAAINMYDNPEQVYQKYAGTERLVFNLRYSVLLALLSGLAFGFGVIDGISPNGFSLGEAWQFTFGLLVLTALPIIAAHLGIRVFRRLRSFRTTN